MDENDWVRQEIACALAHKKNIIPVMLPDFSFPSNLPKDIEDVARINAVHFVMAYFESVLDLIIDRLVSKPKKTPTASPSPINVERAAEKAPYTPYKADKPEVKNKPSPKPASTLLYGKSSLVKTLIAVVASIVVIGAICAFAIWPQLEQPNAVMYTPEIIQAYSGTYSTGSVNGDAIVTITSCDESGNIKGTFEFTSDKVYGKYEISGKITKKKNNGNLTLTIVPGQWIIKPDNFSPLETMEVEIGDDYKSFKCSQYRMDWSSGVNDQYLIKSADDLSKLIGSDATYQLGNDIDLAGATFTPIEGFTGTLLGNGYAIKNFKISSSESNVGLFSTLEGMVSNLKIENATVEVSGRNENVGILCGQLKGIINNISVSGTVTAEKSTNVGGVCGYVSKAGSYTLDEISSSASVTGLSCVGGCFGTVNDYVPNGVNEYSLILSNIKNSGTVTAMENNAGGIVAFINSNADGFTGSLSTTIIDCENTGSVSGEYYVAGIVGSAASDTNSRIDSCTNAAAITAKAYTGCIAGMTEKYVIVDCSNEGSTLNATGYFLSEGKKYAYVGGIVGKGTCLENCTNYADINYNAGGDYVGGIMGYCDFGPAVVGDRLVEDVEANFKNLNNKGNISGNSYVGGIIGGTKFYWSNGCTVLTVTFEKMINTGNVAATNDYAGGIAGYMSGDVGGMSGGMCWCIYDSTNEASVTGSANVGGLFGGFKNGDANGSAYARNTVTIDGCSSSGKVTGGSNFGEIIGLDEIKK